MARSYHKYRSNNYSTENGHLGFIMIILLLCAVWAHKAVMIRVEQYAIITALICTGLVILAMLLKAFCSIKTWRRKPNHALLDVDTMTGLEFERYVAQLLHVQGYGAIRLTEEFDYGVDIIAVKDGITWGIQVKRYSGLVKADAVRQVVTALRKYHCDKAMVVTNSTCSKVAKELARSNDCVLVERTTLATWDAYLRNY
jgi:HJR/Mrr/RecB family endonuclease